VFNWFPYNAHTISNEAVQDFVENEQADAKGSVSVQRFNELHFQVCRAAVVDIAPKTGIDNDRPTV
jgi:hypothetical protein